MNFYGEILCNHCQKQNKVFMQGDETSEILFLEGDTVPSYKKELQEEFECDYCRHTFIATPVIEKQTFQGFLNLVQYEAYQQGTLKIKKKQQNEGLNKEKKQKSSQFHHRFSIAFATQPYEVGKQVQIQNNLWKITKSWKKENIEKKTSMRMQQEIFEQYWYEVEHTKTNETKWLVVSNVLGDNAVLMIDTPVLKEYETIVEIDGEDGKDVLIFEQQVQDRMKIKMYQQKTGVRCLLFEKDEEDSKNMVISADMFQESLEEIQEELETMLEEMNV